MVFALFASACVLAAIGYVVWATVRAGTIGQAAENAPVPASAGFAGASPRVVLFQNVTGGDHQDEIGQVPIDQPDGPRSVTSMRCARVHFAANHGLCLARPDGFLGSTAGYVFGPDFAVRHKIPLSGFPSRARVSPDGRYGATTVCVTGHSYAEAGFSTETTLIDLASGTKLGQLEEFAVERDGAPFRSPDFNFWGVTFARDSDRFFVTLGTGGQTYLLEGSVTTRQLQVLRENVECPSLSPDNTHLAFKKRVSGALGSTAWRFHVIDLATMAETPLAERRSIDDQIEWLDDRQVLYGVDADVWTVPADGSGEPRRLISGALSPAVVRAAGPPSAPTDAASIELPSADLAVAISTSATQARVGETVTYTVTVTNHGPVDATTLVADHDLPAGVEIVGVSAAIPGPGYGCAVIGEEWRVRCDTPLLASGASWAIWLTVKPTAAGSIESRVIISGAERDPNPANDSAVAAIMIT